MPYRKFSLRHVIKNFSEIEDEYSEDEVHFGAPWRFSLVHEDAHLAAYLYCEKEKDENNPWSIEVYFKFRLFSIIGEEYPQTDGTHKFECNEGQGFPEFHSWDDIIKNHMIDNTVVVECDVTILNMTGIAEQRMIDFDEPRENLTDVVLKVEEQQFHVAKMVLAVHSTYFEAMFFRDFKESKSSEIVLNDVDSADFQAFLEIIYGYSNMTEENVEGILELADQFDVALIREKCERFLQQSSQIDKRKKLRLADTYGLENLKHDCLDSIKTTDELKQFLPNDVEELSHSTLAALFQKLLTQK